ncbi:MAG: hypothetical protein AAFQ36_08945 [Pseudomonadota bacterium]
MSIARLKLSEFCPEHLGASHSGAEAKHPVAPTEPEDEVMLAAVREASYASGFRAGVERTHEALNKEAQALDNALANALVEEPEAIAELRSSLLTSLQEALTPLLGTVLPKAVLLTFPARVAELLQTALAPDEQVILLCNADCADHLQARVAASGLTDRVRTQTDDQLGYAEVVLRRETSQTIVQPLKLLADLEDEIAAQLSAHYEQSAPPQTETPHEPS